MRKQVASRNSESGNWLHYVLAFSAFAVIALALMSGKIQKRQTAIEQQFHGIQQMQRSEAADPNLPLRSPGETPLRITLRPLLILLGVVLGLAWLGLTVQKFRRRSLQQAAGRPQERSGKAGRPQERSGKEGGAAREGPANGEAGDRQ